MPRGTKATSGSNAWFANQSAFTFMQTEARLLLTPQPKPCLESQCVKAFKPLRVANASILRHQIERYVALSTTAAGPHADSYHYYIDTALLMQQDAGELYGPWRAEMARTDSCDRDQISFAHTTARLRLKLRLVHGCHAPVQELVSFSVGKSCAIGTSETRQVLRASTEPTSISTPT